MIVRYTRWAMGRIWSDENKYRCWLRVEIAASQALARGGMVPQAAADAIRDRADFSVARIEEIEAEVKHDVIAFTTAVAEHIGPESRWLHYGLTSTDVVDTAQAPTTKRGFRTHPRGDRAPGRGPQNPCRRVQAHTCGRPDSRHPR